ncbi:hypothetical protein BH11ACT4_BH11ACT4_17670 [soil metagenome]
MTFVAGVGLTVSLLVGELSFAGSDAAHNVKIGVLAGSLLAALIGGAILSVRSRRYRDAA